MQHTRKAAKGSFKRAQNTNKFVLNKKDYKSKHDKAHTPESNKGFFYHERGGGGVNY